LVVAVGRIKDPAVQRCRFTPSLSNPGKSRLINTFFNCTVADEGKSLESVTKEVCFLRGTAVYSSMDKKGRVIHEERRKIVLIDTVGLCDSEWKEEDVHRLIKHRVASNATKVHGVLVLNASTERISGPARQSIKELLRWLHYSKNSAPFTFILTKADRMARDYASTADLNRAMGERKRELQEAFGIIPRTSDGRLPIFFTSFPRIVAPEDQDAFLLRVHEALFSAMYVNVDSPAVIKVDEQRGGCAVM
jgi:GTP-binding protein EngB required for normal cell division